MGQGRALPSSFTTQKIAKIDVQMRSNMQAFTLRPDDTTNTEHTHSLGTGCKSNACYMQTDQGKSEAPRMRRKIVIDEKNS